MVNYGSDGGVKLYECGMVYNKLRWVKYAGRVNSIIRLCWTKPGFQAFDQTVHTVYDVLLQIALL